MTIFAERASFVGFFLLAMNSYIATADSYYCESIQDDSFPPESLRLNTFSDGSVSVVLGDNSIWIQKANQTELSATEIFYRFKLQPKLAKKRESYLEIYLSRFSLKLYGRKEEHFKGKIIAVKEYNEMQCKKEPVINLI